MMKNDITYEYRVFTNRLIDVESMEVGKCTSKVIKNLKQKDKVDGRFFHTSDKDEWFFCWNGELQKLNLKGDSDVNAALEEVKKLIADANDAVDVAKTTASEAQAAADSAIAAASKVDSAVESIENKADKSTVESLTNTVNDLSNTVDNKSDKSTVENLSNVVNTKVDAEYVADRYQIKGDYEVAGAAAQALSDAKDYIDDKVDGKFDVVGASAAALNEAKKYVDENIPTDYLKEEVLENYALKSEVPTDYLTKDFADTLYEQKGSGSGNVDLSGYVTKDELESKGYLTEHQSLDGYATENWVENQKYITEQDITGKQDVIDDLETIRSGAALGSTALQSVPEEYITGDELESKGYLTTADADLKYAPIGSTSTGSGNVDLSGYVTKDELESKGYLTEHQSLDGYATESWVENQNYIKEHQDITGKQDVISDLEIIRSGAALGSTALQSVPEEYITKDELESKGYLTEHQSLDNYYTKSDIDNLIGEAIDITNTILA